MAIDPSIILGIRPVETQDPYRQYAAGAQLREAALLGQQRQLEIQGLQRQQDTQSAIDKALAGSSDRMTVLQNLRQQGYGSAAIGLQQGWEKEDAEKMKAHLENQKLYNENLASHTQMIGQLSNAVLSAPPEQQANIYGQVRARAIQAGVATPDELPEQYNPQIVQAAQAQSMKASEVLDAQAKKIDQDQKSLQLRQEAEKNAATAQFQKAEILSRAQSDATTRRGQNLTDAREQQRLSIEAGRFRLEQQKQAIDQGGAVEAQAQQIAKGELPLPSTARNNPYNRAVTARALEINPQLSSNLYSTVQDYYGSKGKTNANITTLNKLSEHLQDLRQASDTAGFTPFGVTGAGKSLKVAENLFSKEDVKFLSGAGVGTEGELNRSIDNIHSPVASIRNAAIDTLSKFTAAAARQVGDQFTRDTRMPFDTKRAYTDYTQKLLSDYGGAGTSHAAFPGKISVTAPDGSVHPFETQAQADRFKKLAGIK